MTQPLPESEIVLYQTEDGQTRIDVRMADDTVWLSQAQMVDLFQSSKANVSEHIRHVFQEDELEEESTVRKFRTVRREGDREVAREVTYHNLDVIICVGDGANLAFYPAEATLTAVDWSPAMVDATQHQAARVGRTIDARVADVEHLPFPDQSFDTVVATFALCCVPDERLALIEMTRVLKPGGSLLLADTIAASNLLIRLMEHASNLITVPTGGHHQTRRPLPIVQALGLDVITSEQEHHGLIERVHALKP